MSAPTVSTTPVSALVTTGTALDHGRGWPRALGPLIPRWLILVGATVAAFHGALGSVANDIAQRSALTYLLAVPLYAVFAAIAVLRRADTSLNIHDRETDIIIGGVTVALALAATALLGPQLAAVYYLWRIDLLMLVVFTLGGSVLLFGLRPTLRFRRAWGVALLLLWPLPVRILIFTVGNGTVFVSAVAQLLVILALIVHGLRHDDTRGRAVTLIGSTVIGITVLFVLRLDIHPEWQMFPALAAMLAALVSWGFQRQPTRAGPKEPVVTRPVNAVVLVGIAAVLGAVMIPAPPTRTAIDVPTRVGSGNTPGRSPRAGGRCCRRPT